MSVSPDLAAKIDHVTALLRSAAEKHQPLALASSLSAEDMVLTDIILREKLPISIFTLETGRLHPETVAMIGKIKERYDHDIDIYRPLQPAVDAYVTAHGANAFYESLQLRKDCCGIRKVEPLVRALKPLQAWVTGQRKDQSPSTRTDIPVVQLDRMFGTPERPLLKFNPLSHWTSKQVWAYIRDHDVPYNALHDRGFISIGCEPCTRPTNPGQHERAGRWWWEEETKKECGLHVASTR